MYRLVLALVAFIFPVAAIAQNLPVYTEGLDQNGFMDWSYATRVDVSTPVHSGTKSLQFEADDYAAIKFQASNQFNTANYSALEMWLYAAAGGNQRLRIQIRDADANARQVLLSTYVSSLKLGQWTKVSIPMSDFGVPGPMASIVIGGDVAGDQPTLFLDDLVLVAGQTVPASTPSTTPVVTTPLPSSTLTEEQTLDCKCSCSKSSGSVSVISPAQITTPTTPPAAPATQSSGTTPWLKTQGAKIVRPDGSVWVGRGVNIFDTRSCNACAYQAPNVAEVKRRIDTAVDVWHADFLRLALESNASAEGRISWASLLADPQYLADIVEIVRYIGTKPGVYVLVSLWDDPSFAALGWPSVTGATSTLATWQTLAKALLALPNQGPHVMFGIVNEPQMNYSGSQDDQVWQAMNAVAQAIRVVEDSAKSPRHLISVQGTRGWSRYLDYYLTKPIAAKSASGAAGADIVYETHVYDSATDFARMFETPSKTLPVIIGEFGVVSGSAATMTTADVSAMMTRAEAAKVPYLAWSFHPRCPPSLLNDASGGGCGIGMALTPSVWGQQLKDQLAKPVK